MEIKTDKLASNIAEALLRDEIERAQKVDAALNEIELKLIERARKRGMSDAQILALLRK